MQSRIHAYRRRVYPPRVMDDAIIHKYLSLFHRCAGCGQVFRAQGAAYVMVDLKAPCCGAPGPRSIWPEPAVGLYIETACRQDPCEEATPRIKVLMIAAAAELIMEQVVWAALDARISNAPTAIALMSRCHGLHQLKRVFKDLAGESVDQVLKREKFAAFAKDWHDVAQARNLVAHGQWYQPFDDAKLMAFADSLIPAGAALWNAAVRSAKVLPIPN